MKKLQVKYCYSETELNEFLLTLGVSGVETAIGRPMLHSVQYCPRQTGKSFDYYTEDGQKSEISITGGVIAIVQYLIEVEE